MLGNDAILSGVVTVNVPAVVQVGNTPKRHQIKVYLQAFLNGKNVKTKLSVMRRQTLIKIWFCIWTDRHTERNVTAAEVLGFSKELEEKNCYFEFVCAPVFEKNSRSSAYDHHHCWFGQRINIKGWDLLKQ